MSLWRTTNGKLARSSTTGKILRCDTCPCNDCNPLRSSYLITKISGGGLGSWLLPVVIEDPPPDSCFDFLATAGARDLKPPDFIVPYCEYGTCSVVTNDIVGLSRQSVGSGTWFMHIKTSFGWSFATPSATGAGTLDPTTVTWVAGQYICT